MQISQIINFLETVAPPSLQESYDNSGLLTGMPEWDCTGALVCLDITDAVIDEAIRFKCNLLVAHHPLIFKGLKRIQGKDPVSRVLIRAIKNDLAIFAIHTNLDNVAAGVNGRIAKMLNLTDCRVLQSMREAHPNEEAAYDILALDNKNEAIGSGMTGLLPEPMEEKAFLAMLKETFRIPVIRHSAFRGVPVQRVALCGGAGSFLISNALVSGSEVFLTADLKYHDFFEADGKILLGDIGHFESEQYTIDLVYDLLIEKFPTFAVLKTGVITNPINYFF